MQRQGFRLGDMSTSGLEFRPLEPGQERRSLVDLLYGLNYPAEYRLELLQTLSHYEQALDALLELAAPYARQLEAQLEGERLAPGEHSRLLADAVYRDFSLPAGAADCPKSGNAAGAAR